MKFEIKHRWTGNVLFSIETESLKLAVEAAVKSRADLRGADLQDAYLQDAYLRGADLQDAYLRGADLQEIKEDFFSRLSKLPNEVPFLYRAHLDGKIDGSAYSGECACFQGTLAKAKGVTSEELAAQGLLQRESNSLTERWYLAIKKGDNPDNNPVSEITVGWIKEWAEKNGVVLPVRKVIWELPA